MSAGSRTGSGRVPLRQLPYRDGVVYGPIQSRRLGWSLGINLCGTRARMCTFDCVYCQFPRSPRPPGASHADHLHRADQLLPLIENGIRAKLATNVRVDSITFAGNGDPSVHPDLLSIVRHVRHLRDALVPRTPVSIFTNAVAYHDARFVEALGQCDNRYVKVDAGDAQTLDLVDRPRVPFDLVEMASALAPLKGVVIQTMVVTGRVDNRRSLLGGRFAEVVRRARAREVQLCTIDKRPAYSGVLPLSEEELCSLADQLRRTVKDIPVNVYFQDCPSGFPDVAPPRPVSR